MKRFKLSVDKLGVVFGTFAPMHTGHVDLITRAKRENDAVLVIVSGTNTERDRGTNVGLHLNRRFRYAREVFNGDELVLIDKLDEESMPEYPNGWEPWLDELHNRIKKNTDYNFTDVTFYIGEDEYQKPLLDYFDKEFDDTKTAHTTLVERSSIPISASEIRENPLKYWRYITQPFRRHFTKKVLIIGSASGGKTTLVKDLGRVYNAPISLEYAREYQERYNVRDDELDVGDYNRLLTDQYAQTSDIIDDGSHSGIIFADTNSTVTKAYIDYYLKDEITDEEFDALTKLYQTTVAREKWDLIFLVAPKTEYVDDGFRDMTMADDSIRDAFTNHLIELMEPFKDKMVILDSNEDDFFYTNYKRIVKEIDERLNIQI